MSLKQTIARFYAAFLVKQRSKWLATPGRVQEKTLMKLVAIASNTAFGKDHNFNEIKDYQSFKRNVPVADYEGIKTYINRVVAGESDVLWKGKPEYIAKTSGTTSGAKYIPISRESMPYHIQSAKMALISYIHQTGKTDFVGGKMIFLQGSPILEEKNGIKVGRLSGIVAHHVPKYLQSNRMPSYQVNCIDDWETKVDKVVDETMYHDMRLISGIPSWVQMYFEKLLAKTGKKTVLDVFPNFSLFVYGGVNFEPYRQRFNTLIGGVIDTIETYPASEGFIAYQDQRNDSAENGLLLELNSGIFYEFIPAAEYFSENRTRLSIADVKLGVNYALVLNTNAGLWGYSIGDTVKFVSLSPHRIVVTGRIKHFISAFGEHVIGEEVERALTLVCSKTKAQVVEFTVAPQVNPLLGLPYHEWFIEFSVKPQNFYQFAGLLDEEMQKQNTYYFDLIQGKVLQPLKVSLVEKGGFEKHMKSVGKLGGQNKIPRLGNDRALADSLTNWVEPSDFTT
jgi:hypothetical protein